MKLLIFFFAFVSLLYGKSDGFIKLTQKEKNWIEEHKKIDLGITKEWFPYTVLEEDGSISGFLVDLVKYIKSSSGLEIKLVTDYTWKTTVEKAINKELDGLAISVANPNRANHFNFTDYYYLSNLAFYVPSTFKDEDSITSFENKTISVVKGKKAHIKFLNTVKGIKIKMYKTEIDARHAVINKKVDATLSTLSALRKITKNYQGFFKLGHINQKDSLEVVFSIRKDMPEAITIINKALKSLPKIKYTQLLEKWFGTPYKIKHTNIVLTQEESDWLRNNPIITVGGSSKEIEPDFVKMSDGTIEGFLVDAYKLLENRLNVKFEYVDDKFSNIIERTIDNEIDLVGAWGEQLTKDANLIPVKLPFGVFIAVFKDKRNTTKINSIKDLYGKKIAYWDGIVELDNFLKQHPQINRVVVDNPLNGFQSILTNKVDYFIGFNQDAYVLTKHNIVEIEPIFAINEVKIVSVAAIRSNAPLLASVLKKSLSTITQEEIRNINKKWSWIPEQKDESKKVDFSKDENQYLKQKGNIKMCVDPHWKPYEWINKDGKHRGMSADIIDLIEKRSDISIELINTKSWSESLEFAKSRKCDILSLAMKTPQREKYMNFTTPYFSFPFVIATKTEELFITNIDDIIHKPLGIHKGYAGVEVLKRKYPSINLIEVNSMSEGLKLIRKGKLFGYIDSVSTLAYKMQEEKIIDIKIAGKFDLNYELAFATRSDERILNTIMQKALNSITKDEKKIIQNKWYSVKIEEVADYSLLWKLLVLFTVIISFVAFSNWILRKKVKEQLSQLREKDSLLIQQSKIAEMGGMLNAITHQLKQPLNVINLAIQNLQLKNNYNNLNRDEINSLINETTEQSTKQVKFMSNTIDDFRYFFKPSKTSTVFNIYDTLKQVKNMFIGLFVRENIQLNINENNSFIILGHENEMMQVLLNIFNNSKDAFNDKKEMENKIINCSFKIQNNTGVIKIEDNAGGIPTELLPEKIFENYVSTKGDKGTGIGLNISKSIIEKKFSGNISAKNVKNGAQFTIELPIKS